VEIWRVFFDESEVDIKQGIGYDRTVHNFTIIHFEIDDIRLVSNRVFPEVDKAKLFVKFHEDFHETIKKNLLPTYHSLLSESLHIN
jgi:hypothetical protein